MTAKPFDPATVPAWHRLPALPETWVLAVLRGGKPFNPLARCEKRTTGRWAFAAPGRSDGVGVCDSLDAAMLAAGNAIDGSKVTQ